MTKCIEAVPSETFAAASEVVAAASTAVAARMVCTGGEAGVKGDVEAGAEAEIGKGAWRKAAEVLWSRGKAAVFFAMWTACASMVDALTGGVAAGSGLELPA